MAAAVVRTRVARRDWRRLAMEGEDHWDPQIPKDPPDTVGVAEVAGGADPVEHPHPSQHPHPNCQRGFPRLHRADSEPQRSLLALHSLRRIRSRLAPEEAAGLAARWCRTDSEPRTSAEEAVRTIGAPRSFRKLHPSEAAIPLLRQVGSSVALPEAAACGGHPVATTLESPT